MASPGELVTVAADVLGMPEGSLVVYDRVLAMAGLRTKSGRGWAAARMQPIDAAHLLTAVLASGLAKDAALTVRRYAETQPQQAQSSPSLFAEAGIAELTALPSNHSFITAMAALLGSAASGSLAEWITAETTGTRASALDVMPVIEIAATTPGTVADIRIAGVRAGRSAQVRYVLPSPWDKTDKPTHSAVEAWAAKMQSQRGEADLEQHRRFSAKTILTVAQALRLQETQR